MSSTQMDLSPRVIDRKQDIASWPEGDIDQLATRDKNRYQKRKAAIIEYFQSDLPVEEISAHHRLSAVDALETMARRCCTLHEDGQQWGFRALVPGTRVTDASSVSSEQDKTAAKEAVLRTKSLAMDVDESAREQAVPEGLIEEDDEDTAERQAVVLTKLTELPQTPVPPAIVEQTRINHSSASAAENATDEEVEQEEFPAPVSSGEKTIADEEVEQEELPVLAGEAEVVADEEVEQEEFSATTSAGEKAPADEEIKQEEFSTLTGEAEEVVADEEVEQEEFPTFASAIQVPEELEVAADEELPVASTGKLSELDAAVQHEQGESEATAEDEQTVEEPAQASELAIAQEEKLDERETVSVREKLVVVEEADTATEEVDVGELDTVEVAKIVLEEHRNRVAAVETIEIPAAMLAVLEKAGQEVLSTAEPITASASPVVEADAKAEEHSLVVSSAISDVKEADSSAGSVQIIDEVSAIPTQTLEIWRRDSQQLAQAPDKKPPTQSLVEDSRYRITGSQVAIKHAVLRRWVKQGRQQKYRNWVRIVSAAVIASILVILLIPLGVGLVGYNAYTNIKNVASDGVNNLLSLQDLIPANKNDITSALNASKLANAKTNLQKAQSDFLQLQDMVNRPDIESLLQQFAPQYSSKLDMSRHLVQVALDASRMGQELIGVAQMGATILHGSGSLLSSSSTTPLFSADDINNVEAALVHAQYYISDIQTQMSQVNLSEIPLGSASQKAKLAKYLTQIPQAQSAIAQAQTLVGPVAWMLGVGQTRHFLVQTLDRGELRPSGGFEGQYGILTLQNGRMSPFSLRDITLLDYAENGNELGATPPAQYSWMNFGNFGVRDANLSADYPTTAKIVMNYFQQEGGGPLDGDIQITPVVIEQFLQITGPIQIKEYGETITAQNLEDKLHQYQQDPRLINLQAQKTGTDTHSTRKAFTNLVGTMLMDRIKHLPPAQLVSFGKILLKDLKTRDLQVYLNNSVAEQWLTQNGYNGAMPQYTNGTDGFMVVQSNVSISKAAQYVKSTFKDNVTLDSNGGATHNLTITLNYQQTGPVYGFNTYADYMRVYAPANAQLINAYGFNTGSVLCTPGKPAKKTTGGNGNGNGGNGNGGNGNGNNNGGNGNGNTNSDSSGSYQDDGIGITGCGQYYYSFPDTSARNCPGGNYELGYDGMMARPWPVSNLGSPSSTHSDLPGYSMWGGLTLTPKNCISTITLSWYVPHVVQNTPGQSPYRMIVGHQAGWPDTAQISINASALKGVQNLNYNQSINVDTLVALPALPSQSPQQKPGSTPTPAATPKKP